MKTFCHFLVGLSLLFAAGCATPKRVQVTPSNLNYATVTYANTNLVMMMEFQGTGYCTMSRSTNPSITNPFWQRAPDTWDTRLEFSPEEMTSIFQTLVNADVFGKEPKSKDALALPYVRLMGRIENKGFDRVSKTPEFLEVAELMAALFDEAEKQRKLLR
jgi:hypothetical protein